MFGIVQNRPKIPPVETTAFLFLGYEKLSKDWRLSVAAKSELSRNVLDHLKGSPSGTF
jgi:hypothetical protein